MLHSCQMKGSVVPRQQLLEGRILWERFDLVTVVQYGYRYTNLDWNFWSLCIIALANFHSHNIVEAKSYFYFHVFSWLTHMQVYRKISNIRHTKSQNLNDSHLVLKSSLPNPFKPCVKSRMKMSLEQRRQAMLQLHLSDRQFHCLLRCVIY